MQTVSSILVYTDLSPASAEAVRAAKALARATHAALEVVRVVAEPLTADWTAEMSTAGLPAVQEAMETEAQEWLDGVLGEVGMAGVELNVAMGDPAGELARRVETQRPDLVVLGAERGNPGRDMVDMARDLLASVSCSVLLVRA